MGIPSNRRNLLAKIHVAKKQLALEDDSYRALLLRITGQESAGACSEQALDAVLTEFKRLGFAPKRREPRAWVRKIHALWRDLAPHLDQATGASLDGFVLRQTGVQKAEWLNPQQATKVIQGLEGWLGRVRKEGAHADAG